jgi:hypothetical protein
MATALRLLNLTILSAFMVPILVAQPAQTPENARTFIVTALIASSQWEFDAQRRGLNTFSHSVDIFEERTFLGGYKLLYPNEVMTSVVPPLALVDATWVSDCLLSVTLKTEDYMALEETYSNESYLRRKKIFNTPTVVVLTDFSKDMDITHSGRQINFKTAEDRRITVISESMAARLAYAMDFLAGSCDKTAGLGF